MSDVQSNHERLLFFDARNEIYMDEVVGKIISLPELKIQLGNREQLD